MIHILYLWQTFMWVNNSHLIIYWNVNQCRSVMFHSSLTLSLSPSLLSLSLSLSHSLCLTLSPALFHLLPFLSLSLPPSLSPALPLSVSPIHTNKHTYTISHLFVFRCVKTENCPNFHSYLKQLQQFPFCPQNFSTAVSIIAKVQSVLKTFHLSTSLFTKQGDDIGPCLSSILQI